MANIKSQIKRNRQNEKARVRNKAVKSELKTAVRKFREAAEAGYADQPHLTRDCGRLTGLPAAALVATGAGPAGERLTPA